MFNIQYFFHHMSKHYETNFMHPYLSRVFKPYQEYNNYTMFWEILMGQQTRTFFHE